LSLVALAQGLRTGQIWGAALDTLPSEPPARLTGDDRAAWEYLRAHPAVLLTPHIAGLTEESELRLAQSILLTLRTLLHGHTYP
jgi:phosphoglycerate dehydrogenase-like enzyme